MNIETILLLTRCSRLEYLDLMYENILETAKSTNKFRFKWCISFDCNTIQMKDIDIAKIKYWQTNDIFEIEFSYSASNEKLYASNIANDVIYSKSNRYVNYVYLLDDDNKLHDGFVKLIEEYLQQNEILCFGQLRLNRSVNEPAIHVTSIDMNANNCVGWVDSAQFIIPMNMLMYIKGYADGYCIDGETIKKCFNHDTSFKHIQEVGSYYNYFTELKDVL